MQVVGGPCATRHGCCDDDKKTAKKDAAGSNFFNCESQVPTVRRQHHCSARGHHPGASRPAPPATTNAPGSPTNAGPGAAPCVADGSTGFEKLVSAAHIEAMFGDWGLSYPKTGDTKTGQAAAEALRNDITCAIRLKGDVFGTFCNSHGQPLPGPPRGCRVLLQRAQGDGRVRQARGGRAAPVLHVVLPESQRQPQGGGQRVPVQRRQVVPRPRRHPAQLEL